MQIIITLCLVFSVITSIIFITVLLKGCVRSDFPVRHLLTWAYMVCFWIPPTPTTRPAAQELVAPHHLHWVQTLSWAPELSVASPANKDRVHPVPTT